MMAFNPPSSGSISNRPDADFAGAPDAAVFSGGVEEATFAVGGSNVILISSAAAKSVPKSSSNSDPGMCQFGLESSHVRYRAYVHIPCSAPVSMHDIILKNSPRWMKFFTA